MNLKTWNSRRLFKEYAMRFIGVPYVWGGENPNGGMDCSGFAQEMLKAFGKDPIGDQTAAALYRYAKSYWQKCEPKMGCIVFYGSNILVTHTAVCIDEERIIEAGGGGKATTSVALAARHDAFVRMRPVFHRRDYIACFDPFTGEK